MAARLPAVGTDREPADLTMPWAAPRYCTKAGHPSFTGARCPACIRASNQVHDQARGSAASRGYDASWKRLRLRILAAEPLCRFCAEAGRVTPAVDVDHIDGFNSLDDPRRLDPRNCRPLCKPHHSARTARDQAFGRARGIGGSIPAPVPARTALPVSRVIAPKLGVLGKGNPDEGP